MKYLLSIVICLGSMLFADVADRACHPDRVFIGAEYQYRRWLFKEGGTDNQNLWGGVAGYEHMSPCSTYVRLFGRLNAGKMFNKEWNDHEFTVEGNVGYSFDLFHNFYVTPYTGMGYFQDHEDLYDSDTAFYHENLLYIPLGLLLTWDINCHWTIGLKGQADFMVWRELHSSYPTLMNKKTSWLAELPVTYRINRHWDLSLVGEYAFSPNTNFSVYRDWGALVTYGVRLETGYRF